MSSCQNAGYATMRSAGIFNGIEPRKQLMTNTVGMASRPSQLVRVPVQSNVERLNQLQMSSMIQKRLEESDRQVV